MSSIDYSKLRNTTARRLLQGLRKDGFILERQIGSHQQYYHPDGRRVTVSYHSASHTFKRKTLKGMVENEARWTADDLKRLGLLK